MSASYSSMESMPLASLNPEMQKRILFVNLDPALKCPLCKSIMKHATQTHCGHIYCSNCVEDIMKRDGDKAYCPGGDAECKEEVLSKDTISVDFSTQKRVKKLQVRCMYFDNGCDKVVAWEQLEKHSKECPHADVECPNKSLGCSEMIAPMRKEQHLRNSCRCRIVSCPCCHADVMFASLKRHEDTCPKVKIQCPNRCGTLLAREDLKDHEEMCKGIQIKCSYHKFGCTFEGTAEECQAHETDPVTMNQHVMTAIEHVKKQNIPTTDHEKQIEVLQRDLNEHRESKKFLTSECNNLREIVNKQRDQIKKVQSIAAELLEKLLTQSSKLEEQNRRMDDMIKKSELGKLRKELDAVQNLARDVRNRGGSSYDSQMMLHFQQKLSLLEDQLNKHNKFVLHLKDISYNGIFIWRVDNYSRRKQEAINGENISLYSPPFYVGRYGYNMRARVYLNGDGNGRGTHISFFITIIKGEYDSILRWPYRQKTTLMLLDQSGGEQHIVDSFIPTGDNDCFKKPVNSMNLSSGTPLFATQSIIDKRDSIYKKDDTIFLRVQVDTTGLSMG